MTIATHRLVSLAEAAEILAVSTKSVRRRIAAGDLDAVRLGRRTIRIKTESLDRLIDAREQRVLGRQLTWSGAASTPPPTGPRMAMRNACAICRVILAADTTAHLGWRCVSGTAD